MKVVLFCGGLGTRLGELTEDVPKPLVKIGYRPILWHLMKYYAYFGHKEFILCLGYKADVIKSFFLNYSEAMANDFVLSEGGANVRLLKTDIHNWNITFVDTGLHSNIGMRLRAVREHLGGEEHFLASYGDTLTDADLPAMIDRARTADVTASFVAARPNYSFHVVDMDGEGYASGVHDVTRSDVWINGGFFVLHQDVFDHIGPGEDLVNEPFARLMVDRRVLAQRHDGFWAPMDTLKDKQSLEQLHESGTAPWQVWDPSRRVTDVALAAAG